MSVARAIDKRIETPGGDRAEVEGRCAKSPKLLPTKVTSREARHAHDGIRQTGHVGRPNGLVILPGTLSSNRLESAIGDR